MCYLRILRLFGTLLTLIIITNYCHCICLCIQAITSIITCIMHTLVINSRSRNNIYYIVPDRLEVCETKRRLQHDVRSFDNTVRPPWPPPSASRGATWITRTPCSLSTPSRTSSALTRAPAAAYRWY